MAPTRDRRPGFSRRAQYSLFLSYVLAVAGAVVGVALLALSRVDPPAFAALRSLASETVSPAASALSATGRTLADVPDAIGSHFAIRSENRRLRAENAAAARLLTRARTLARDNARLRRLLAFRDGAAEPVAAARLVGSSAQSTRRFGLLNAGTWQGVREGQPVVGPDGLVGRVLEVGPTTARVLLLTDPESVVPVRRTRDGLAAIVVGRGDGAVEVRSVGNATAAFRPGDLFLTSGTGGIFPPGVPVARIAAPGSEAALARPYATPDTLDVALVLHAFLPPPPPPRRALP
jgi:rod shape-determining protein MreC